MPDLPLRFRDATVEDIPQLHRLRMSVKENMLNNPSLVKHEDYVSFLTENGRGWLCESGEKIAGFAIIDNASHNIWALFVDPYMEGRGIGRFLHDLMMGWHFSISGHCLWLTTAPGTRAERFYRKAGWLDAGMKGKEILFEMTLEQWQKHNNIVNQ